MQANRASIAPAGIPVVRTNSECGINIKIVESFLHNLSVMYLFDSNLLLNIYI